MASGGRPHARGGDTAPAPAAVPATFADCYAALRGDALQHARALTRDREQAEDAVAEVFVRMYRRWDCTSIDQPRAYVRRAVANEVASGFRRLGRERALLPQAASDHCAVDAGERICEQDALGALLAGLPPRQRAAVTLRYLLDLSEAEVARRMGTSVGAVKSNTARGIHALRAAVSASTRPSTGAR